jgi:hypothetical protein
MFKSGSLRDFGIGYWGPLARDGVWHEALSGQLLKSIPPINPGLAGVTLSNYHFYYDLLVSLTSRFGIPINLLIYKIFPIIFSILLGAGTYKLANVLFKDEKTSLLAVFFTYFASSFGWIVNLIKGEQIGGESSFWANQPVSMNINPPFAASLIIIIFTILLIDSYLKKQNLFKSIFIIILSGTLIGFKVYAGAILLAGLFILGVKRLFFDKNYQILIISVFSLLISLIILFPQIKSAGGVIEFNPFWLVNTMIDAGDRVGIPNFTSRRFTYLQSNQWLKFFVLEIICFIIFFVGNLGTRIVGFFGIKKEQFKNDLFILIFGIMIASFIPPLIFVQKGNAWNIIQFFYYFLFFSGLFAAYALRKIPLVFAIIIMIITPISSIATFRGWLYPIPPAYLSTGEYKALKYLSIQKDGTVLKHPFDQSLRSKFKDPYPMSVYADNTYVSAFSGKSVFVEDVEQQIVLNSDYKTRLKDVNRFFVEKDLRWSAKFLKDNNIRYIYLPKIYQLPMAEGEYPMRKIFENEDVNIYIVESL